MQKPPPKVDFLDAKSYFSDGLGSLLEPAELWRAGLSRATLAPIKNLFCTAEEFSQSSFSALDIQEQDQLGFREARELAEKGLMWIIEPLKKLQPLSYAILSEPKTELMSGFRTVYGDGLPGRAGTFPQFISLVFVRDRAISLHRYYPGWSPEEGKSLEPLRSGDYPEFLLQSWWYRIASWKLARSLPGEQGDSAQPLLQWPGCGTSWNDILAGLGTESKKKYTPIYKDRFGAHALNKIYSMGRTPLLCILDTRPPETANRPCGDQLFLNRGCNDSNIYHVHKGRFDQPRVLPAAVQIHALDHYFSHVLARVVGEFDFLPYSELL
jgi:hypothetical protein